MLKNLMFRNNLSLSRTSKSEVYIWLNLQMMFTIVEKFWKKQEQINILSITSIMGIMKQ